MTTLKDVQQEVNRQIARDYGNVVTERLRTNISLGLAEEAGEVAGLMKRVLRDFPQDRARTSKENFINEMGDVLWYLTACCQVQGTSLDEIWEYNIKKLKERYKE